MSVPKVFWLFLALFQIVFGSLVFIVTRSFYATDARPSDSLLQSLPMPDFSLGATQSPVAAIDLDSSRSPEEVAQLADQHFANRQYDAAVALYDQLLSLDESNVDLRNNLAISLHYVGRSTEALEHTQRGIAAQPDHQRIRLTQGFILAQTGRSDDALDALNAAIELDASSEIAASARQMISQIDGRN